jgi:hypothetical protein
MSRVTGHQVGAQGSRGALLPKMVRMAGGQFEASQKKTFGVVVVALHGCDEPGVVSDGVHVLNSARTCQGVKGYIMSHFAIRKPQ